jgi:hypothetical protein
MTALGGLATGVSAPGDSPLSVESEFFAALPASIISADLAAASSDIVAAFSGGSYPAWYQSLPAEKTVIMSVLGVSAPGDSTITSATSSISSNTSGSFQVSSNGSSTSPASSASSSGATAAGSSSSHAGAPAATAGIVIGVAGAAGILGMALIL